MFTFYCLVRHSLIPIIIFMKHLKHYYVALILPLCYKTIPIAMYKMIELSSFNDKQINLVIALKIHQLSNLFPVRFSGYMLFIDILSVFYFYTCIHVRLWLMNTYGQ